MAKMLDKIKAYFSKNDNAENKALKDKFLADLMAAEANISDLTTQIADAKAAGNTERVKELEMMLKSSNDDYVGLLTNSLSAFPDMQKYASELAKTKEITSNVGSFISGILDSAEANKQIKEGQRAQSKVKPFENVRQFQRSSLLQDQIRQTKQASTAGAINQATGGLRSEIDNQFQSDVNKAAITSGGQSGAFQANSQAASRARLQNLIQLQDQQSNLRNQNDRNLNYLATQQINENQAADVSDRFRTDQDWRRYSFETDNAADLEQAGRKNARSSRNYIIQQIPGLVSMGMQPRTPAMPPVSDQRIHLNPPPNFKSFPSGTPDPQGNFFGPLEAVASMPRGVMSANFMRSRNLVPRIDFSKDEAFNNIDKFLFNHSY